MKSPWLVACEFNRYTAILTLRLIILTAGWLTDNRILVHLATSVHDVITEAVTIYQHHFCDFSPFQQSVKEKEKQRTMKGLAMA